MKLLIEITAFGAIIFFSYIALMRYIEGTETIARYEYRVVCTDHGQIDILPAIPETVPYCVLCSWREEGNVRVERRKINDWEVIG
jgi:hypothetical protein